MSTISDVARRAGVSIMTVSRVINGSGHVGEKTRQRVEAAIAELGYVRNSLARSLRLQQTKSLALVLTDITNTFFTSVARSVEDVANRQGFTVLLCNTDESEIEQAKYLQTLVERHVDGVLLVPATASSAGVAFLQAHGVPVVLIDRTVAGCEVDVVRGDSVHGAHSLTRLLLDLGHRAIAVLTGPADVSTSLERVAGYHRAMAEAGSYPDASRDLVFFGQYTQASGYEMAQSILKLCPQPSALIACNNFIAIGAYHALRAADLRVPEDIALVCFDDLPITMSIDPFLTAATQPAYEIGRRATELLLARLAGAGPSECQNIVLPVQVIVRRSSGSLLALSAAAPSVPGPVVS